MIEYKSVDFYNEYFRNHDDFSLVEDFTKENEMYVGKIQADNVLHTPVIEVEIPLNFPHSPLQFWTSSLGGYPHLITGVRAPRHNKNHFDKSWFCLNTPFAETAEGQLYHELCRLRGWFEKFLNPNLPAIIEDPRVQNALRMAHLLEWENPDEIQEVVNVAGLTFVGDFADNPQNFKDFGYLHCRKTDDRFDRFHLYAYKVKDGTNLEVPYIVVDKFCGKDNLNDFLRLRQFYQWETELQEKLLPEFDIQDEFYPDNSIDLDIFNKTTILNTIQENRTNIVINPRHENAIDLSIKDIENLEFSTPKRNPLDDILHMEPDDPRYEEWCERQDQLAYESYCEDQAFEKYYEKCFFAIGFKENGSITWFLFWTNRATKQYKKINYCFGHYMTEKNEQKPINLTVRQLTELPINWLPADIVDEKRFFGRGAFDKSLTDKKVAIIGAGAIGSLVAMSLVRGGAKHIGIWDGDTVEPGNLCRSIYTNRNVGENKARELSNALKVISPFCKVSVYSHDLYGNINYQSQENVQKELKDYEVIIDCTASNELLHYLSYSIKDKLLLSMCITNRSQNLLCISNADGNPFEIRKAYLAKIVQDTRNYYIEGTGCYSPTFLATNSDIATLVNIAMRGINKNVESNNVPRTYIYSYDDRGVIAEYLHKYQLTDGLSLIVSNEILLDIEELQDSSSGIIGKLYGCYSHDGRTIFITHCVSEDDYKTADDILAVSQGVIDFIGEYRYSTERNGEYPAEMVDYMRELSSRDDVNTNNPLLALRNTNGTTTFYLYIDDRLELFNKC